MKPYLFSIFFLLLTIGFFVTSMIVGTHLDENGFLVEPAFFCIPLGYLSLAITAVSAFLTRMNVKKKSIH